MRPESLGSILFRLAQQFMIPCVQILTIEMAGVSETVVVLLLHLYTSSNVSSHPSPPPTSRSPVMSSLSPKLSDPPTLDRTEHYAYNVSSMPLCSDSIYSMPSYSLSLLATCVRPLLVSCKSRHFSTLWVLCPREGSIVYSPSRLGNLRSLDTKDLVHTGVCDSISCSGDQAGKSP